MMMLVVVSSLFVSEPVLLFDSSMLLQRIDNVEFLIHLVDYIEQLLHLNLKKTWFMLFGRHKWLWVCFGKCLASESYNDNELKSNQQKLLQLVDVQKEVRNYKTTRMNNEESEARLNMFDVVEAYASEAKDVMFSSHEVFDLANYFVHLIFN